MKGLLLKDAYQAWYYAKMVVVAAVVMMGVGVISMMNGANFFIVYAGFLLGMMPMTLLAYDQTSKFNEYSAALPATKEQLVGCKYIVGLCGLVLAEAFAAAALGVAQLHWVAVDGALVISTLVQVGMTTLLSSTILLPLSYRFGYEKAKVGFLFYSWCTLGPDGLFRGRKRGRSCEKPSSAEHLVAGAAGYCGGGSGAVCAFVAAVRCMVRKGRAVK